MTTAAAPASSDAPTSSMTVRGAAFLGIGCMVGAGILALTLERLSPAGE